MNELQFIEHLDETYFNNVENMISYYVENELLAMIKDDPMKGVRDFVSLLRKKGVLKPICNTLDINVPSYLDKEVIYRHVEERCNQIRQMLIDNICTNMKIEDSLRLRRLLRREDILKL